MAMQSANRLHNALKSKSPTFGAWQMLPGTNLCRAICRSSSSIDWLLIDQEHGNISDDSMHELVAAAAACGVSPIVRVPDAQHWMIKRALDAGAHGILVPLLQTAKQAQDIVSWSKFPPQGTRGFGSPFSMEKFVQQPPLGSTSAVKEVSSIDYLKQANSSLVIAVQIETSSALAELDAIAAVPGIDVLFVGPFDLGNNIGHPIVSATRDPELVEAIASVQKAAEKNGISSGIYCNSGEEARSYADKGFGMCSAMTDMVAVPKAFGQAFEAAKGSYVHAGVQGIKKGVEAVSGPYGK
nr:hypothetical protein B0A51_12216 [Rachicladosporium sp. CCFEE 5018]